MTTSSKCLKIILIAVVIIVFLFIYLPIFILILFSFNDSTLVSFPMSGFTTNWYKEFFADKRIMGSIKNSLIIALCTTLVATIAGTGAAFVIVRTNFPGKRIFVVMVVLPLMIPAIMLGLSLLTMFKQLHVPRGLGTVIMGYSTFTTSFVTLLVCASLYNFDISLEEAARDLYAGPFRTFMKVTLPGIFPGVLAGALFAFSLSFDEYIVAFLNIGVKQTIPLVIMAMLRYGLSPKINALATIIYFVSFIMALVASTMLAKKAIGKIV